MLTAPSPVLRLQPMGKPAVPDHLQIQQNTLPIGEALVGNKSLHQFAGIHSVTLNTEIKTFALCAGLHAAGGAVSVGLITFASMTLRTLIGCPVLCDEQVGAGAAIHAAISIQYIFHVFLLSKIIIVSLFAICQKDGGA